MTAWCKDYIQELTSTNKGDKKVKFSYIAFDAISYQETVRRFLNADSTEDMAEARKFVFSKHRLILLEKELLQMSINLNADAENIMIVRDLVDFNYENAKGSLALKQNIFSTCIIIPMVAQFFIPEDYPLAIRVLCILIICA